jgi:hypothetical protein
LTVKSARNSRSIDHPTWQEDGFLDLVALGFWSELPDNLQRLALAEFKSGNLANQILRNDLRGIVLLEFERGPLAEQPMDVRVVVHTAHKIGNYYCEGTACIYEDLPSGCFLAFCNPDFN